MISLDILFFTAFVMVGVFNPQFFVVSLFLCFCIFLEWQSDLHMIWINLVESILIGLLAGFKLDNKLRFYILCAAIVKLFAAIDYLNPSITLFYLSYPYLVVTINLLILQQMARLAGEYRNETCITGFLSFLRNHQFSIENSKGKETVQK